MRFLPVWPAPIGRSPLINVQSGTIDQSQQSGAVILDVTGTYLRRWNVLRSKFISSGVALGKASELTESRNNSPIQIDSAEQRYRLLVDHSPDAMCVHADGRVVYVNPAGVRGIGAQTAEQLVGRMITDFVHPDSIPPMLARIGTLRCEGDSSFPSEAVMLRVDGSPIDVEAVSVLTTWNGKPAYQVIFRDLTMQKAAEATLRYQAALVSHVSDAIIATTTTGIVTSWNPAAEAIYRRPAARALALPVSEAVDADIDLASIVADGGMTHAIHRAADGSPLNVRVSVTAMDNGYVMLCSDYTALRRAEKHFQSIVKSLHDGVVVLDHHGGPQSINPAALRILGLRAESVEQDYRNATISFPMYDADGNALSDDERPLVKTIMTHASIENEVFGLDRADGTRVWLSISCCLLDPADPDHSAVLISFSDITAQHDARVRLAYQANHDPLTGLPNRAHIEKRVLGRMEPGAQTLAAVMFIDLDNLKMVNDKLGHHAGDTVITVAAQRLRSALRSDDFIARVGGDEFVVLLYGSADLVTLRHIAGRMHTELAKPVAIAGTERPITASIGVTKVIEGDSREAGDILRDADAAMYTAKVSRTGTHYA